MSTPKIFISYSHDSSQHQQRVLALSNRLRTDGFDCNIDQYEVSPNEGWPRWMSRQIREADFVLVVCTETYLRRFNGDEAPGVGQGVRWESMLTIQDLYDADSLNMKFVPVVFASADVAFIPKELRGATRVHLDGDSGYEQLLRRLLNVPPAERPPLGGRPPVAPRERQAAFFSPQPEVEISLAKLPSTSSDLFGRDEQLAALDEAWEHGRTNVVTLVAVGGVGKTALVNVWLGRMREDGFRGARRVYGWSFYSQGTSEDRQASGDEFLSAALNWFGVEDVPKSAWDRGERLAQLCRDNRTLLILDGLEPLQHPPGEQAGKLRDPGVQSLLRELAFDNPGLCVVSSRIAVDDLKDFEGTSARRMDLEDLSPQAGAQLLAKLGVEAPEDELEQVATDFAGHALALTLLGSYLAVVHDGDVRKRDEVPPLTIAARDGGHARRVMECYERWFAGKPELCVLRMLGLFDRPAEGGAIEALRKEPPIEYLTDALTGISDADWKFALRNLRDVRLVAEPDPGAPDTLDCHPHVREHFGARLREEHEAAWREGHDRLFEYFRGPGCAKELPETLQEMAPLFAAVLHGCRAGRHEEALYQVYVPRTQRGRESYSTVKLGAFGADLSSLAGFFERPWLRPVKGIRDADNYYVLGKAGFRLRGLGRLREAEAPMRAALEQARAIKAWINVAIAAGNLSELLLTLGDTAAALKQAQQGVALADRSRDRFQRIVNRAALADVLFQSGGISQGERAFHEAEWMQKARQQQVPILYSTPGFKFCNLLLDLGRHAEVTERATQTLAWVTEEKWLLDIALDHLSLGRAALMRVQEEGGSDFTEAEGHLRQAVEGLREAGQQDDMPRGYLARAELYRVTKDFRNAQPDLDEAMKIATRSGMRLHEADAHLEYARLQLAMGDKDKARASLAAGKAIAEETGYHRRDGAVKELDNQLG
ncbi:MAG: TIR domain-containing protein [Phycisphaerales bacterium]|nr:MAG: TIR domain-containing protein [Phycisphaerales bacterium]